jgi:enoyl-CoA hydratase/carnithine racemase
VRKRKVVPLSSNAKVTVERRGQIVLIGINRPYIHNRIDPETYAGLAQAYYQYEHDPSLCAAVLFGHGDKFSRGIEYGALYRTEDFKEGRRAEAEGRLPIYQGK